MKPIPIILTLFLLISCSTDKKEHLNQDYLIQPIPFNKVQLLDNFWKPRLKIQKDTLVPFALKKNLPAVENLAKTAKFLQGDTTDLPFPHRYISSDLYKTMEGASYILMENPDPVLEAEMDSIINIIAAAQQEDGYLYVAHITGVSKDHAHWGGGGMGDKPYSFVVHSHELYNMGHMYEAAIAYYQATGKDKWLKVAEKNAQHINKVFFEGDPNYNDGKPVNQAPGHQEIELALTKLYRVTGNELYLQMAKKFLDIRGVTYVPDGEKYLSPTYAQQHLPVSRQKKAVGHAVRATYQYAGMADVEALTGQNEYNSSLHHIWKDLTDKKMHITGGLGAMHGIEGFGEDYVLPNKEAYNETCAAVGNVFFNFRMFLLTGEAKYIDVAEVALYNNALAGVNMDGNRFFYVNPLETDGTSTFNHGNAGRSPWFGTACCPSNIARLIPQVSGMMYSHTEDEIYTLLYGASQTFISLEDGDVEIKQRGEYPLEGAIEFDINPKVPQKFTLHLRVPTWVQAKQFVPGNLYHYYFEKDKLTWSLFVNGEEQNIKVKNGFASIKRLWQPGDLVNLSLEMPIQFNSSHELIEANKGKVSITRGPLVYCAEEIDNQGGMDNVVLKMSSYLVGTATSKPFRGKMKNVVGIALTMFRGEDLIPIRMLPYYAWNNRGNGAMKIWFSFEERGN